MIPMVSTTSSPPAPLQAGQFGSLSFIVEFLKVGPDIPPGFHTIERPALPFNRSTFTRSPLTASGVNRKPERQAHFIRPPVIAARFLISPTIARLQLPERRGIIVEPDLPKRFIQLRQSVGFFQLELEDLGISQEAKRSVFQAASFSVRGAENLSVIHFALFDNPKILPPTMPRSFLRPTYLFYRPIFQNAPFRS